MWDLSSQISNRTRTRCLGGEGVSMGQPGRSLPQPLPWSQWAQPVHTPPQHRPSSPYPVPRIHSARPECPQEESQGCSLFQLQRHLPQTPAQEPPVVCLPSASAPVSAPLCPPVPRTSSGARGSAADPHIPHSADTGTVWGRVCTTRWPRRHRVWCEVTVPEPCPVRPAHNTQEGPQQRAGGGPCSGQTSHSRVSAGAPGAWRLPDAGAALPVCPGGQKPKHKTEGIL